MIDQANIILSISAAAMLSRAPTLASPLFHGADGEVGVVTHPSHVSDELSCSDFQQTVKTTRKDGSLWQFSHGAVVFPPSEGIR